MLCTAGSDYEGMTIHKKRRGAGMIDPQRGITRETLDQSRDLF